MSDAISALDGARFDGIVVVEEAGLRGMITLRGDLTDAGLQAAVKEATGVDFPGPREIRHAGDKAVAWMSPDELLIIVAYEDANGTCDALSAALGDRHALVVNTSDARTTFRLQGGAVRDVLAKLTPADMSPQALKPGEIRRSRIAQTAAALWMTDESTVELVTFRSSARYSFDLLCNAAKPGGEVGYFPPPS